MFLGRAVTCPPPRLQQALSCEVVIYHLTSLGEWYACGCQGVHAAPYPATSSSLVPGDGGMCTRLLPAAGPI